MRFPVRAILTLAIVSLVLPLRQLSAEVNLQWKFAPGQKLHIHNEEARQIEGTEGGSAVKGTHSNIADYAWSVEKVHEDGSADIKQTVQRLQLKAESPLGKLEYDSNAADGGGGQGAQINATLGKLVGESFTYKLSPAGTVTEVAPSEQLKAKFEGLPAQFRGIVDPKMLISMIPVVTLAGKPVAVGGSWADTNKLPDAPIGSRTIATTYTLGKEVEAEGEKLQEIGISQKTDFVAKERPGTTFELKDMSGSGQALFDTNAGRLVSKILEESFTMVVTVQGMRTEQRSKTKVTTTFGPATDASAEKPAPATEEKKPAAQ